MPKMNAVNVGMNKYCGPAVLSILTGKSTDECAYEIGKIRGNYNVSGVLLTDLLKAADRLGFDNKQEMVFGTSLYSNLTRLASSDGMYIITVPHHFVVIEVNNKQILFCDNHTKEPMPAQGSARLLQTVQAIHKVFKRREPEVVHKKIEFTLTVHEQIYYDNNEVKSKYIKGITSTSADAIIEVIRRYENE